MKFERHPLSALFEDPTKEELAEIKKSLLSVGQIDDIYVYQGKILDGWSRWLVCDELGLEPRMREYEGEDPYSFVCAKNFARKHYDATRRARVALKIAHEKQKHGAPKTQAYKEAAKVAKVSVETMRQVSNAKAAAPEVKKQIANGTLSHSKAAKNGYLPSPKKQAAKPPPKPEKEYLADAKGHEIPDHLKDVFCDTTIPVAVQQLEALIRSAKSASQWAPYLKLQIAIESLDRAKRAFEDATPYVVHDQCGGKGCKECLNGGYWPKWRALEAKA